MSDTTTSETTALKQRPAHWFAPGRSGNPAGRPRGSRHKLAGDFLSAFADDFSAHGAAVIERVRVEQPAVYLKVAADLLPKESVLDVSVSVLADVSDTLQAFRALKELLGADPAVGMKRLRQLAPRLP